MKKQFPTKRQQSMNLVSQWAAIHQGAKLTEFLSESPKSIRGKKTRKLYKQAQRALAAWSDHMLKTAKKESIPFNPTPSIIIDNQERNNGQV